MEGASCCTRHFWFDGFVFVFVLKLVIVDSFAGDENADRLNCTERSAEASVFANVTAKTVAFAWCLVFHSTLLFRWTRVAISHNTCDCGCVADNEHADRLNCTERYAEATVFANITAKTVTFARCLVFHSTICF